MLIDSIRADMKDAMRAKDAVKLRTLRSIIAAVQQAEVAGSGPVDLTDADVEKLIAAQAKRRIEAAEAFESADRAEQAAAEREELAVLEAYLPEAMDSAELEALVDAELAAGGFTAKDQMGAAMKAINAKVAGRADGRAVADLVKVKLN